MKLGRPEPDDGCRWWLRPCEINPQASDHIKDHSRSLDVVIGHADWYAGNTVVAGGALVGTFDWELVADSEAVIAGFAAACYASSSTSGGGLSEPAEAAEFLRDYEAVRGVPMSDDERQAAAGAVAWIIAFNARWQVALLDQKVSIDFDMVTSLQRRQAEYLALNW